MTILEMVRSMMSCSTLPISFWGYTLKTTMHILNLVPSKFVPNTPKELWSGCKPNMRLPPHLGMFGTCVEREV